MDCKQWKRIQGDLSTNENALDCKEAHKIIENLKIQRVWNHSTASSKHIPPLEFIHISMSTYHVPGTVLHVRMLGI